MTSPVLVRDGRAGARFDVRVAPRGSRTGIAGVRDGALLVRVTAPPVDGAATEAVVRLLAQALDLAPRDLAVVSGARARRKTIEVRGLDAATLHARLSAILR